MCQLIVHANVKPALTPRRVVKQMLRDIAFVLHATQKVKKEILADRELVEKSARSNALANCALAHK